MQPKISIQLSKWRSVFWASRLAIDSIESSIAISAIEACQTSGIQVKMIAGDRIATAKANEFQPLNQFLAVKDDRTNTAISFILLVNGPESMTIRCGNCRGGDFADDLC
jgi:hypothetical protein